LNRVLYNLNMCSPLSQIPSPYPQPRLRS
jgi:hypothetical protein